MLGKQGASAAAAGPVDYASGAFLAFLHNLSPAEEPVACVSPAPTRTQTPAYCCAPSGHCRRGASNCPHSLFVALSQLTAKSRPRRSPRRLPQEGEKRREPARQPQRREGRPSRQRGAAAPLLVLAREEEAAAQDSRGSSRLGAGGAERAHTPRGAHRPERGPQNRQERGTRGPHARRRSSGDGRGRTGRRAGGTDRRPRKLGKAGASGCRGRRAECRAGRSGETSGGISPGGLGAVLKFEAGGAMEPKRPTWVGVVRAV